MVPLTEETKRPMTDSTLDTSPGRRAGPVWMPIVLGAALLGCLYLVFFVAPVEQRMGDVQRIFYFHVSSAMSALLLFFAAALMSAAYLILSPVKGFGALADSADRLAHSMAEVAVVLGLVVLTTGPLWAKAPSAWGTFWRWEPRLTLTLLTEFLFIAYLVLRATQGREPRVRRVSAGVAVIGGPSAYLVHFAIDIWGQDLHNHPKVVSDGGGGLADPAMQMTFGACVLTMMCFAAYLTFWRSRHHRQVAALDELYLDSSDLVHMEEDGT
jgi:heme exporter protein C